MWPGEQAPPPLPPPVGKGYDFPAGNPFDWKSRGLRPSRALPGAEGTDSPPHHPFSDSAEILWISGRGICKEAIFSPGSRLPSEKISTFPPHMSLETIGGREDCGPLELSRSVLMKILVPDDAERGALCSPTPPSGTGCERVHTLSRSPGAVRSEVLVSGGTGGRRASACGTFASAAVCTKISFLTERVRDASRSSVLLLPQPFARKFRS